MISARYYPHFFKTNVIKTKKYNIYSLTSNRHCKNRTKCSTINIFKTKIDLFTATFPDTSGGVSDSRTCLKDSSPGSLTIDTSVTNNHLDIPRGGDNPNLLSPEILNQRRGSRRPSILPVPDMFTSSTLNISAEPQDEGDESEDELEDDVPWRSPSEKIA